MSCPSWGSASRTGLMLAPTRGGTRSATTGITRSVSCYTANRQTCRRTRLNAGHHSQLRMSRKEGCAS